MSRTPPMSFFATVKALCGASHDRFRPFDPKVDYVGPAGSSLSKIIPQEIYGCNVRPAAWVHDCLYEIGGTENDREKADLIFHALMLQLIEDRNWPKWHLGFGRFAARYRATSYYEAVRIGGGSCFSYSKRLK